MGRRRRGNEHGVTLLEVLVAFVVLTLITGVAMQIFSGGARVTGHLADGERAAALAESRLALVSTSLREAGQWQGRWQGYEWQAAAVDVTPEGFARPGARLGLYRLTVTVLWRERGRMRSHTLTTLRVVPAGG